MLVRVSRGFSVSLIAAEDFGFRKAVKWQAAEDGAGCGMNVAELNAEAVKLSREEQTELAAYLTDRLRRAASDQKDLARMMDDGPAQ